MTTYLKNRISNCGNSFQGQYKKVLCVCSAGLLRSPTAAFVLSNEPFNCNTRAAGLVKEFALIPVDEVLLEWADEIVCMESNQKEALKKLTQKHVICLEIEDSHDYRSESLIRLITQKYADAMGIKIKPNASEQL